MRFTQSNRWQSIGYQLDIIKRIGRKDESSLKMVNAVNELPASLWSAHQREGHRSSALIRRTKADTFAKRLFESQKFRIRLHLTTGDNLVKI